MTKSDLPPDEQLPVGIRNDHIMRVQFLFITPHALRVPGILKWDLQLIVYVIWVFQRTYWSYGHKDTRK
jgi:hypothetical protein